MSGVFVCGSGASVDCGGIEPAGAMFREHTKLRGGVENT